MTTCLPQPMTPGSELAGMTTNATQSANSSVAASDFDAIVPSQKQEMGELLLCFLPVV